MRAYIEIHLKAVQTHLHNPHGLSKPTDAYEIHVL